MVDLSKLLWKLHRLNFASHDFTSLTIDSHHASIKFHEFRVNNLACLTKHDDVQRKITHKEQPESQYEDDRALFNRTKILEDMRHVFPVMLKESVTKEAKHYREDQN